MIHNKFNPIPIRNHVHNNQGIKLQESKSRIPVFSAKTLVRMFKSQLSSNFNEYAFGTFKN